MVYIMKKAKKEWNRAAGILMPIFSLPSPYGCGTLGKEAFEFVDFCKACGSKYWQVLPVGPTSFGDSPYQGFSAFAGNPYFIDLGELVKKGLLDEKELREINWGTNPEYVDYGKMYENRYAVLRKAYEKDAAYKESPEYAKFIKDSKFWINDYALFMACKNHFEGRSWQQWDEDISLRSRGAVAKYTKLLADAVEFQKWMQFTFFEQWHSLKDYANSKGIEIIGDIPLYVSLDSADCWSHRECFEIEGTKPVKVAGCPPDAFSEDGQLWGNPIYKWDYIKETGFKWWKERMRANAALYDVIRIDHFIGIVNYWSIPAKAKTAKKGRWVKGPGIELTKAIEESIGEAKIIAEDLGVVTQPVRDLMAECGYPGMKIIEFACDGDSSNEYLPHNYKSANAIVYAGTHDNETLAGWLKNRQRWQFDWMKGYFGILKDEELHNQIIRKMYESTANVVILQMQDILGLDNHARINEPATCGSNWQWRMLPGATKAVDTGYYSWMSGMFSRKQV
jgi:4-alpha-glucanotransferase